MKLTVVYDTHTEGHAIYIEGMLRGEWEDGELTPVELLQCYHQFADGEAVVLESTAVDSEMIGIWTDEYGVEWPEQLGTLFAEVK